MTKKKLAKLPRSIKKLFPQVTEAYDADKPVEVSVSRRDCKVSKRLNPTECALAHAAKRELKADGVIIGMGASYIIKGKTAFRFSTPESVKREIVSFDRHQDFAPGDYYLIPPSPSRRFGVAHALNPDRNRKAKRKVHLSARVRVLEKGAM